MQQGQSVADEIVDTGFEQIGDEALVASSRSLIRSIKKRKGAMDLNNKSPGRSPRVSRKTEIGNTHDETRSRSNANKVIRDNNDGVEIDVSASDDDISGGEISSHIETETDHSIDQGNSETPMSSYESELPVESETDEDDSSRETRKPKSKRYNSRDRSRE